MKLIVGLLVWIVASAITANLGEHFKGYDGCFALLDVDTGKWERFNEKRCAQRFSPCSTFKIPNSLIALETGAVKNVDEVTKWDGVHHDIAAHNRDQTMRSAFKESVVWYYQKAAAKVGIDKETEYVKKMHYGNQDTAGGVTRFWLDGSLRVSADEQCEFMRDFMLGKLPFKPETVASVKEIMTMYSDKDSAFGGKTGSDSDPKTGKRNFNWFVGYVIDGKKRYVFASNITGTPITDRFTAMNMSKAAIRDLGIKVK
jgi:beta-lactamase class D